MVYHTISYFDWYSCYDILSFITPLSSVFIHVKTNHVIIDQNFTLILLSKNEFGVYHGFIFFYKIGCSRTGSLSNQISIWDRKSQWDCQASTFIRCSSKSMYLWNSFLVLALAFVLLCYWLGRVIDELVLLIST